MNDPREDHRSERSRLILDRQDAIMHMHEVNNKIKKWNKENGITQLTGVTWLEMTYLGVIK